MKATQFLHFSLKKRSPVLTRTIARLVRKPKRWKIGQSVIDICYIFTLVDIWGWIQKEWNMPNQLISCSEGPICCVANAMLIIIVGLMKRCCLFCVLFLSDMESWRGPHVWSIHFSSSLTWTWRNKQSNFCWTRSVTWWNFFRNHLLPQNSYWNSLDLSSRKTVLPDGPAPFSCFHLLEVKDHVILVADNMGWDCLLSSKSQKVASLKGRASSISLVVPALLDLKSHLSATGM